MTQVTQTTQATQAAPDSQATPTSQASPNSQAASTSQASPTPHRNGNSIPEPDGICHARDGFFSRIAMMIAGLCVCALILGASVTAGGHFRPLYYSDLTALDIPVRSGLSYEEARANYDALIDYNRPFTRGELDFPTLPMSETGRTHFAEVKRIFNAFAAAMLAGLFGALLLGIPLLRRRRPGFLILGGVCAVAIPGAVGALLAAAGWDNAFTILHGILFDNAYWIFDAATDPVILILPDTFFLHALLLIIAFVCALAPAAIIAGARLRKRGLTLS